MAQCGARCADPAPRVQALAVDFLVRRAQKAGRPRTISIKLKLWRVLSAWMVVIGTGFVALGCTRTYSFGCTRCDPDKTRCEDNTAYFCVPNANGCWPFDVPCGRGYCVFTPAVPRTGDWAKAECAAPMTDGGIGSGD